MDDPNLDKQGFLNKLITRVNSSDPETFAASRVGSGINHGMTNSQNIY